MPSDQTRRMGKTLHCTGKNGGAPAHRSKRPRGKKKTVDRPDQRLEIEAAIADARRADERLHQAIDILPQGIVFLDSEGRYILWNKAYAQIYAKSADLFAQGARLQDTIRIGVQRGDYPEALGREEEWIAERLAKLYQPGERHEQKLADGRTILIEERRTADGGIIGLRVDITELKQREASFRLLFEGNPVPMIICHADDGRILRVNEAAIEHYGHRRADFEAMNIRNLQARASESPWSHAGADRQDTGVWTHVRSDGQLIDVAIYSRHLVHDGQPAVLLALMDITARRRAEARLAFLADHDALTGLPNRALLRQQLEHRLRHVRRAADRIAVLVLGIDNFNAVNETIGHAGGDRLLRAVANRLKSVLRTEDLLSRISSDEFAIVEGALTRPEDAGLLADRLQCALGNPFLLDGQSVSIAATIGIAMAPVDGEEPERLLKNAGLAMSRGKREARGTYSFFEPGMDARAQDRRRLEADLHLAIQTGALQPYYQPQVDLRSGRIVGFEALVRWPHPERGMVMPAEFIPIAEQTGLIGALGTLILRQACIDAASWPVAARVAINLSPLQFRIGCVRSLVNDALRQSGLPASRLELEITESLVLEKSEEVLATLHALRALGVRISMDDFGTGYSSLSYLRSFPFDKIKIDRSFVQGLDGDRQAQAIVRSIVNLGHGLDVTITAEGVETPEELRCLQAEQCDEAQGYLFSPALPNADAVCLLRTHGGETRAPAPDSAATLVA